MIVNVKRTKKFDVYIGRSGLGYDKYPGGDGYFGNPYKLSDFGGDRKACLEAYREYFTKRMLEDPVFRTRIEALRGKKLGCFCWPDECHGEVIVDVLTNGFCKRCGDTGFDLSSKSLGAYDRVCDDCGGQSVVFARK